MFSLDQNGENLMISLEIDLEWFGTHLEIIRKSNFLIIWSHHQNVTKAGDRSNSTSISRFLNIC